MAIVDVDCSRLEAHESRVGWLGMKKPVHTAYTKMNYSSEHGDT